MMTEFNCKVSSTWSACGKAFTHRHLSSDEKEEISQLDYIIWPMRRNDEKVMGNLRSLSCLLENTRRGTHKSLSKNGIKSGLDGSR